MTLRETLHRENICLETNCFVRGRIDYWNTNSALHALYQRNGHIGTTGTYIIVSMNIWKPSKLGNTPQITCRQTQSGT